MMIERITSWTHLIAECERLRGYEHAFLVETISNTSVIQAKPEVPLTEIRNWLHDELYDTYEISGIWAENISLVAIRFWFAGANDLMKFTLAWK